MWGRNLPRARLSSSPRVALTPAARGPWIAATRTAYPGWLHAMPQYALEVLIFSALIVALGALGFWLMIEPSGDKLIWPPAGLALAALWFRGYRLTPGILIGWIVLALLYRLPWNEAATLAIAQVAEAAFGCFWLRSVGFNPRFTRLTDSLDLMFFAGFLGGLAGACVRALGFLADSQGSGSVQLIAHGALHWWLADALAILLLTPLLLIWTQDIRFRFSLRST